MWTQRVALFLAAFMLVKKINNLLLKKPSHFQDQLVEEHVKATYCRVNQNRTPSQSEPETGS
jgi:hypothetical protein